MDAQKNRPLSPESLSEGRQQQWQHFIAELIQLLQGPKVEFLWGDETAVYDDWIRPMARAPVGQPVENFNHRRTQPRKQTLIAAMSAQKVFAPRCFEGSLDRDKMLQWLQELRPQLPENHVLILDNARPHHARKVREYLADHPIRILFLPPYSPQMNPIEKLWAAIKQQWRQRRVRGFPPLQATLQADLQQIVEKSGKAIVASCGYSSFLS